MTARVRNGSYANSVLAGCQRPAPDRAAQPEFNSETLFGYLEHVVHAERSDVLDMELLDECTMRIHWTDGVVRNYDFLRLHTGFPKESDERYALLVRAGKRGNQRLLVATPYWGQFMMARSSISNLQGLCSMSRSQPEPGTDAAAASG